MICPHCNRRTLYAPADREAIGSCLSCGDIYQASVTREEIAYVGDRAINPWPGVR